MSRKRANGKQARRSDPTSDNPATEDGDALSGREVLDALHEDRVEIEQVDPRTRSYTLPGPVGIALSTGRTQFIGGLIRRVREGFVIEPAQVIGMLEVIRDWTDARQADDRRNTVVRGNLAASITSLRELRSQLGQVSETVTAAHRVAHRHGCGEPLGPDDED